MSRHHGALRHQTIRPWTRWPWPIPTPTPTPPASARAYAAHFDMAVRHRHPARARRDFCGRLRRADGPQLGPAQRARHEADGLDQRPFRRQLREIHGIFSYDPLAAPDKRYPLPPRLQG